MYEAIRHFAYYLYGGRFTVVTDHRTLVTLMTAHQHNRRLHNWAMKLSEFDFGVEYRSGKENIVADCLSRCHETEGDGDCADSGHQQSGWKGEMWASPHN